MLYFFNTLIFLFVASFFRNCYAYNSAQLINGVWLSGAAYCGKEQYKTMILSGPATGFTYKETLYDPTTDLQGLIGILPTTKSIYIIIRGSSSILNWMDDFEVRLVPYSTFPECNCTVHTGFYKSALAVAEKATAVVKSLQIQYPGYSIVSTGHSYGASCALLLAMEFIHQGITNVQVYNYGQPRTGDSKYAAFVNSKIKEYYRTTHNRDIVPHLPPIEGFGYKHSCGEIFEDDTGTLTLCSNKICEDPKGADQYKLTETNGDDHSYYLGHRVSCEESIV